jgi:hypothetical protein
MKLPFLYDKATFQAELRMRLFVVLSKILVCTMESAQSFQQLFLAHDREGLHNV